MSLHVLRANNEIPGSACGVTFDIVHASNLDVGFAHFFRMTPEYSIALNIMLDL